MRVGNYILERYSGKTSPVGKIISKLGNGYDVETLDAIVPTLTAKAKLGYRVSAYVINTRLLTNNLYQYILVQGCHGGSDSTSRGLSGVKKVRGTGKGWWKMRM